jgi:hypothetical protein
MDICLKLCSFNYALNFLSFISCTIKNFPRESKADFAPHSVVGAFNNPAASLLCR